MKRLMENSAYLPGEKEAMDALDHFERDTLPTALENAIPGSAEQLFISGVITFESDVPVITGEENIEKAKKVLIDTFKVAPDKVTFKGLERNRLRKTGYDRVYSDGYQPYRTVDVLVFHVDWHDTTEPDLVTYRDYIRDHMKSQGIVWERVVLESLYSKTRDRTEQFLFDVFVGNKYGTMKWPCIADWDMTKDSIELAFDYRQDIDNKVAYTTRQSVEKRLDNFMMNEFTKLYNKELNTKAWYTITPAGVDDDGSGIVIYSYDINSFNSKRKDL